MANVNQLKKQKILVVDDALTIHNYMKNQLNELGFKDITCVASAKDAWHELNAEGRQFGLIFCDINMPEETGVQFLKRVRADNRFNHTFFIMLTMESDIRLVAEAATLGVNGYVLKPFTKNILTQAIEKAQIANQT